MSSLEIHVSCDASLPLMDTIQEAKDLAINLGVAGVRFMYKSFRIFVRFDCNVNEVYNSWKFAELK